MTQTTTPAEPPDILMNLIVALLAPMFISVTAGDVRLAQMAAIETIDAYSARNRADLIAIAQIIACGLAALGSLSLSMDDEISLNMVLRLRGNAVSLSRSAEQNRRALREPLRDNPGPYHPAMAAAPETPALMAQDDDGAPDETFLEAAAEQLLSAEADARLLGVARQTADPTSAQPPVPMATSETGEATGEKRHRTMWAIAMVKEAGELTASIPGLPPAERSTAAIRAGALGHAANELLTGVRSPPPPLGASVQPNTI
jgi:hypothetical protein